MKMGIIAVVVGVALLSSGATLLYAQRGLMSHEAMIAKAAEMHEALDYPKVAPWRPAGMSESAFKGMRMANALKYAVRKPIGGIVAAHVSKTMDTGEPTISLITADGESTTLWLERPADAATTNSLPVRSITAY